jgi:hypothetical protein
MISLEVRYNQILPPGRLLQRLLLQNSAICNRYSATFCALHPSSAPLALRRALPPPRSPQVGRLLRRPALCLVLEKPLVELYKSGCKSVTGLSSIERMPWELCSLL